MAPTSHGQTVLSARAQRLVDRLIRTAATHGDRAFSILTERAAHDLEAYVSDLEAERLYGGGDGPFRVQRTPGFGVSEERGALFDVVEVADVGTQTPQPRRIIAQRLSESAATLAATMLNAMHAAGVIDAGALPHVQELLGPHVTPADQHPDGHSIHSTTSTSTTSTNHRGPAR